MTAAKWLLVAALFFAIPAQAQVATPARRIAAVPTVADLPAHEIPVSSVRVFIIFDGVDKTDCTVGGGSELVQCLDDGTNWVSVSGSGSASNFVDLLDVTGGLPHNYTGYANHDVLCVDTTPTPDEIVTCTPSQQSGYQLHSADGGVLEDTDDVNDVFINTLGVSLTITKVTCKPDQASAPTIMLQKDDGSAANMFSAAMTCDLTPSGTDGTDGILTSFVAGENVLAAGDSIKLLTATAGGVATYYTVYITYKRTP